MSRTVSLPTKSRKDSKSSKTILSNENSFRLDQLESKGIPVFADLFDKAAFSTTVSHRLSQTFRLNLSVYASLSVILESSVLLDDFFFFYIVERNIKQSVLKKLAYIRISVSSINLLHLLGLNS